MIEFNKLIGIAHQKGDSKLTVTIFFGMKSVKINLWASARKRPAFYFYNQESMEFIYKNWNLGFTWYVGIIRYHKKET